MRWIPCKDELPPRNELCDFLFAMDAYNEVLISCRTTLSAALHTERGAPIYWRPAAPLPTDERLE